MTAPLSPNQYHAQGFALSKFNGQHAVLNYSKANFQRFSLRELGGLPIRWSGFSGVAGRVRRGCSTVPLNSIPAILGLSDLVPHKILVVDDDAAVRGFLEKILNGKLGYEVHQADSGKVALDLALKDRFDLVILDVRMPELSGSETYQRLRAMNPEIEAIFFTGAQDFDNSHDFLRFSLPSERVLQKPLRDIPKFTQLIVGILGPPKK
jgi:CheY-like chemotaxis protein